MASPLHTLLVPDPVALAQQVNINHPWAALALVSALAISVWLLRSAARNSREHEKVSRRYASTVNASLDAVVVSDEDGRIVDFNTAAEKLFGYSRNAALGSLMSDLIVPPKYRDAHAAGMKRLLVTGRPHVVGKGRVKMEAMRANGEIFPAEISIGMTENPEGPTFTGYIRDISDQIKAQEEITLARDEALAAVSAKSQFLAVMSHEMRTPLNGVLAVLDILASGQLDAKQRRFVEAAINSGELLQRHIDDLLQLNELENRRMTFHRSTFSVREIVRDVIAMNAAAAATHGNKIFFDSPISDVFIIEDRHRLSQILVNLVSNAVKFTRDGRIQIEADRIVGENGEDLLEFIVSDTGPGIAEEDQERIFDTFVTMDPTYRQTTRGYGLGLAICRRIVRAMGGEIGVDSKKGQYSRFWVRMPFREASASATKNASRAAAAHPFDLPSGPAKRRVLLVEDDETNRLVGREMLAKFGCLVTEAGDGVEAVEAAETGAFDLILMDVNMPRMGGLEATQKIRASATAASRSTPIIAVTAHAAPEEQERLRAAGMQECMIKPLRARNLQALFRRMNEFPGEFSGAPAAAPTPKAAPAPEAPRLEAPVSPAIPDPDEIDESVIGEMASMLPETMFKQRLALFRAEIETITASLGAAWTAGDITAVTQLSHRFGGSAALFGATRLRARLMEIETAAKRGDSAALPDLLERLSTVCPRTIESVRAYESA